MLWVVLLMTARKSKGSETHDKWHGVTYKEDNTVKAITKLKNDGFIRKTYGSKTGRSVSYSGCVRFFNLVIQRIYYTYINALKLSILN